jgi:UDP-glucose 4-epimerase
MKILITGASGFIARNLISYLLLETDNTIFGISRSASEISHTNYIEIIGDLTTIDFNTSMPNDTDVVIHLAQSVNYRNFPEQSQDVFNVNTQSTFRLLEWSRQHAVKRFIFASTGNVYSPKIYLLHEDDVCIPTSFYAASKLSAEHLVSQYGNYFSPVILRFFSVYGPGQKGMLIPNLIASVLEGKKITLAENKGLVISPIFIDDCVKFIYEFCRIELKSDQAIFNVAGNEILSLRQIVDLISDKYKSLPNIEITNNKPVYLIGSNDKLKLSLNIKEFTSFYNGISKINID